MAERRPPKVAPSRPQVPETGRGRQAPRSGHVRVDSGKARAARVEESGARPMPPSASGWARVKPQTAALDTVTHRMRERLAERKRTERRRIYARIGKWAAIAALAALALWAFFMSPLFALEPAKVELSGVSAEIDAAAVSQVIASHEGESLALLNVPHVADQLRDLTGVLDASIERVWPAGLRIELTPRRPVAAIPEGDGFVLLDADAIEVGVAVEAPTNLPVVTVPVGDERILAAVLEVIRNLPADLLGRVGGVGAQTEDTVSFTLRDGPRVEWGSSDDSALKAQVLVVMLASPSTATAAVIDVSAPTLPITRPEG